MEKSMTYGGARARRQRVSAAVETDRSARAGGPGGMPPRAREGLKDTTESIVVAFILAFVFRAFLIEAFVIPTGSMAATLYGKHGTMTCADCGWEFAFGLADQSQQRLRPSLAIQANTPIKCQNCGYENRSPRLNDIAGNAEAGDRILVLKWPYDLDARGMGARRWDVTVFKDPNNVDVNFIKRLVGMPNEVLELIDGDLYTVPVDELSDEAMETLEALRHLKYLRRDEYPDTPTRRDRVSPQTYQTLLDELADKLRICRKTAAAQQALWTVVYNHDYIPQRREPQQRQPYWRATGGDHDAWDASQSKIRCRSRGLAPAQLEFAGKDTDDFSSYNSTPRRRTQHETVADLQLGCVLVPEAGQGYLELVILRDGGAFRARIMADGQVALYRSTGSSTEDPHKPLCATRLSPLEPGRPIEITFTVLDYRASLQIDGDEVLATSAEQYVPNIRELRKAGRHRAGARMLAEDLDFELWHVVLKRDVYYVSQGLESTSLPASARTGWGTTGRPIWLRDGEYFVLGDNSPASKDSRLWAVPGPHLTDRGEDYQLGTVPEDQLIGRAFFVYWPSGHRTELIPFLREWGLIPNFGRMRWIR